jgi:O-acetyl-ADP-ribose deacetylase (regulator of RNase III)
MTFKLILSAITPDLFEAFKKHFAQFPQVEVVNVPFEMVMDRSDCVVSAANSFGLMDGGVDQCITDFFGIQMMKRVQERIIKEYWGEQPIGTSMIVRANEMADPGHKDKYVAHTPTMRIPMDINKTSYVYMAMKAMLIAVERHNLYLMPNTMGQSKINTVVCPGLGTNAGRVPAEEAAKMMSLALYHFLNPPKSINWFYATQRHSEIQNRQVAGEDEQHIDLSQFEDLQ